jgi:hypothetical protein
MTAGETFIVLTRRRREWEKSSNLGKKGHSRRCYKLHGISASDHHRFLTGEEIELRTKLWAERIHPLISDNIS